MQRKHIELVVDEPVAGYFYWVLMKLDEGDGQPKPIDHSPGPMPSRSMAMMAGIAALERRTEERDPGASRGDAPDTLH